MQDEVNSKVVALSVRVGSTGAKMSAHLLRLAMKKFLEEGQRHRTVKKEPIHGKQTVRELMKQDTALTNIEITDQNIKSFERVARKYNIDFALKKDKSADPPRYLVFFKGRDVDVMTAAFKEYSAKELARVKKPSVRKDRACAETTTAISSTAAYSRLPPIRLISVSAKDVPTAVLSAQFP